MGGPRWWAAEARPCHPITLSLPSVHTAPQRRLHLSSRPSPWDEDAKGAQRRVLPYSNQRCHRRAHPLHTWSPGHRTGSFAMMPPALWVSLVGLVVVVAGILVHMYRLRAILDEAVRPWFGAGVLATRTDGLLWRGMISGRPATMRLSHGEITIAVDVVVGVAPSVAVTWPHRHSLGTLPDSPKTTSPDELSWTHITAADPDELADVLERLLPRGTPHDPVIGLYEDRLLLRIHQLGWGAPSEPDLRSWLHALEELVTLLDAS